MYSGLARGVLRYTFARSIPITLTLGVKMMILRCFFCGGDVYIGSVDIPTVHNEVTTHRASNVSSICGQ